MRLEGEHVFDAPREAVWEALLDPAVLARVLPGTERLERVEEGLYRGLMKVAVGPVSAGGYDVTVRIVDPVRPESYRMEIDGRGGLGFARGTAEVRLSEEGSGQTRMHYSSDLQIGGKVAGIGQRLVDNVAKTMTARGLDALAAEIRARVEGGE
ncbi:MAG TPA: carbon monoxide dehydrogenase subunit G [Gemmatimonadota bacterium]|nr:carbon monoxide dehydrogenase subunit G [Gemmatimonadota bacterium]